MLRGWSRQLDRSALAVTGVALALQAAHLALAARHPTFLTPVVDAGSYHQAAQRFAGGGPLAFGAFWQPPLFPFLLGCLYRLTGPSVIAASIVLAALGTFTCVIVWWLGTRLFSRRVGLVAGLILAGYGPFLFFSSQLLPTGPAVFLDVLALALWIRALDKPRWDRWLVFGLTVGLATITVPNSAVVLIVALPAGVATGLRSICHLTGWKAGPTRWAQQVRERILAPAVVACVFAVVGTAVPILCVTTRNVLVAHEWVVISANGGINL